MNTEWKEFSLSEIYEISSGLSKPASAFGSGFLFLSFKDVFNNYFIPEILEQLVESSVLERQKGSIKRGDVFITRTSETMHELGMTSVALKDYKNATFNGFTKRLRPRTDLAFEIHPEFMGYCLRSPGFRTSMLAFSTMSTRASLNNDMISRLQVRIPPLEIQKKIGKILKSLDDKIHLNTQINQTLEQIAQAIFKSWFVDFDPVKAKMAVFEAGGTKEDAERAAMCVISGKDENALDAFKNENPEGYAELEETAGLFPWAMQDSELGDTSTSLSTGIPEGWEISEIGKEVAVVGGGTPSTKNNEFWDEGDIHWTTPKDLSSLTAKILIDTDRKITQAGLKTISSGLLPADTVLMSSRAPVGYLAIAKTPLAINQGYIAMKCEKRLPYVYVLQWCTHNMDEIKQRASGTTFAEISKANFKPMKVIVPANNILSCYALQVNSIYSMIESNIRANKHLSEIRDTLLPKLLKN